eukprot:CAMPEP_0204200998 /NCGR_PEP_ID=MMETSP0361-20130328/67139_1 /ASSEMBLY_ACC=CAM_ASM_000343 /TAXON_ID=268821 /ORGANISM="Scrippsiella Hangoei, Strain SHTV-5" /LENGTH=319 /DNA_ID=CAMNT_0051163543 /DNA_START=60 /DNA_END=1019 /DNA_ORIENTATION=+
MDAMKCMAKPAAAAAAGPTRTVLWTVPRAISTAFERAILALGASALAQRGERMDVLHEPFGNPFYFGPLQERQSTRYAAEPPQFDKMSTIHGVSRALLHGFDRNATLDGGDDEDVCEPHHVFSKDMAYYIRGHINKTMLEGVQHTFLIRHPIKSVPSLYRGSMDTETTGWDYFDRGEVGYKELHQIFEVATKELGQKAVVVDADELLADPEGVMSQYCNAIGIPFSKEMLSWEPGPVPGWETWPGWHDDAINSTGLLKKAKATKVDDEGSGGSRGKSHKYAKELAIPEVQKSIAESLDHYEALYQYALQPRAPAHPPCA